MYVISTFRFLNLVWLAYIFRLHIACQYIKYISNLMWGVNIKSFHVKPVVSLLFMLRFLVSHVICCKAIFYWRALLLSRDPFFGVSFHVHFFVGLITLLLLQRCLFCYFNTIFFTPFSAYSLVMGWFYFSYCLFFVQIFLQSHLARLFGIFNGSVLANKRQCVTFALRWWWSLFIISIS